MCVHTDSFHKDLFNMDAIITGINTLEPSFLFNQTHSTDKVSTSLSFHLPSLRPGDWTRIGRKTNSLTADLMLFSGLWSWPAIPARGNNTRHKGVQRYNHSLPLKNDLDEKITSFGANNIVKRWFNEKMTEMTDHQLLKGIIGVTPYTTQDSWNVNATDE